MELFEKASKRLFNSSLMERALVCAECFKKNLDAESDEHTLSELSKTGCFKKFYFNKKADSLHLIGKGLINEDSQEIGLLMAYVGEGGLLSDLEGTWDSESEGLDIPGLANTLLQVPPQRIIACSGLAPSSLTSKLYCQLVRQMLEAHNDEFVDIVTSEQSTHEARMNLISLSALAKIACLNEYELPHLPARVTKASRDILSSEGVDEGNEKTLAILKNAAQKPGCPHHFTQIFSQYFLKVAFYQALNTQDTQALVDGLMNKAQAWAKHLRCPIGLQNRFAEQLVATALFATPGHFNRAGFGFEHLVGFPTPEDEPDVIRTVLDGPLAILMRTTDDPTHLAWILSYSKALHPDFSLNAMIAHRGLGHTRAISYLDTHGGHVPAIEQHLIEQSISPSRIISLLHMISNHDCYASYSPQALDAAMAHHLGQITGKHAENERCQSMQDGISSTIQKDFDRAFELNPAFKDIFIKRLENTPGLTSSLLRLFRLDTPDVQILAEKMPLKERGLLTEDQLGL